jgi:hypothetical protein
VRGHHSERPRRILDPHGGVDLERVFLEERGRGAGNAQSLHHSLHRDVTAGGIELNMQIRDRAPRGQNEPLDVEMGIRRGIRVHALPVPIERQTLPLQVRPRAHLRRGNRIVESRRSSAQVDAAPHLRFQLAGRELEIDLLGIARSSDADIGRQGAEAGHLENVLERAARRLMRAQRAVHALRIEAQIERVIAGPVAIDSMRLHVHARILERDHAPVAGDRQGRRSADERRPELYHVDREPVDVDVRDERFARAGRARRQRRAFHVEARDREAPRPDAPLQ